MAAYEAKLAAKSIGYSTVGSGLMVAKIIDRLGLTEALKARTKSRTWAAELRTKMEGNGSDASHGTSTAVLDGADDAIERAAKDDPAEGPRT